MNYRHKRTGGIYRRLFESFDVERQQMHVVYINSDGQIFNRSAEMFAQNFEFVDDPQIRIKPKIKNEQEAKDGSPAIELFLCECGGEGKILSNGIGDYFVRCELCGRETDQARCEEPGHAAKRWNTETARAAAKEL